MEKIITSENTLICIDTDDASAILELVNNKEGDISKEFYDWYLKKHDYFIEQGYLKLIGPSDRKDGGLVILKFNLTNPEEAIFESITKYGEKICKFYFQRMENTTLDIDKIDIDVEYYNVANADKMPYLGTKEGNQILDNVHKKVDQIKMQVKLKKGTTKQLKQLLAKATAMALSAKKKVNINGYKAAVGFTYGVFYYFTHFPPQIVDNKINPDPNEDYESVPGKYVYNGFIDLNKVTKITLNKRDPNLPKKEYQRHIGQWTVRGHYRNINGNLVWVKGHTKGEGDLEHRTYGTNQQLKQEAENKTFHTLRERKKLGGIKRPLRKKNSEIITDAKAQRTLIIWRKIIKSIINLFQWQRKQL
jgi:hypothetical protein